MKYIYTDIYKDFSCIGGNCPDNCCIGWDVLVDQNSYNTFLNMEEPEKNWILQNIEEVIIDGVKGHKIRMNGKGRCPFLNEQNLCNIYIHVSPDVMCHVCKLYPRKLVRYYDVICSTVTVSCPEVARILLQKRDPISFGYAEDASVTDTKDADWDLYNELINGLVLTTDILQDRQYPFWKRVYLLTYLTFDIQSHISEQKLSSLRSDIECYKNVEYRQRLIKLQCNADMTGSWGVIYALFEEIEQLAGNMTERKKQLDNYKLIAKADEEKYRCWNANYRSFQEETEYENLAVEFVFEYYMDALTGKNLFENIVKMALLLIIIRTCEMLQYNLLGELSEENRILIISNISRIMEHTGMLDIMANRMIKSNKPEELFQLAYLLY